MNLLSSVVAAAACALVAGHAASQYPSKPVRMIVPFPAGGLADIVARVVAAPLSQSFGQPVLVENKAGADGQIAALETRRSPADGHTLFFATNSALLQVPLIRKSPPYDPVTDFTPISFAGTFSFFLFVHSSVPVNSFEGMIDYARSNPNKLSYGSANMTSFLATMQLLTQTKIEMVHIPYKGEAPAIPDLAAGRVQVMFATPTSALPLAKEGKLRVLAALLPQRSSLLPDVPTMAELGYPQVSVTAWGGFFGPAKLPNEVTVRLAREFNTILARSDVREQVEKHGFVMRGSSPEELADFLNKQLDVWARSINEAKLARE
ncbi:MAG TPA: tripartite tricarboxylate transporter substrate binding protein [Pseudolabrys sp.]